MRTVGVGQTGLRTTRITIKLSLKTSYGQSPTLRIVRLKVLRELLSQLIPSGRYPLTPFLKTKIPKGQTKYRSRKKSHQKMATGQI